MAKLSMHMFIRKNRGNLDDNLKYKNKQKKSNLKKVRMDYSCHGRYKDIHIVLWVFFTAHFLE